MTASIPRTAGRVITKLNQIGDEFNNNCPFKFAN